MSQAQPILSVCIPTYEMAGRGAEYLAFSLEILSRQDLEQFDVVVSDHSLSEEIEVVCKEWSSKLQLHYHKNTHNKRSSSANTNNAMAKAKGKYLKILFQDDYLLGDDALSKTVQAFEEHEGNWLVSACEHTKDGVNLIRPYYPSYNHNIHLGENTISSPSVVTVRNEGHLLFDENLTWLMDCDYYKRCYDSFGEPITLNEITVVNRMGEHQVSNTIANTALREREYRYILKKYGQKMPFSHLVELGLQPLRNIWRKPQ